MIIPGLIHDCSIYLRQPQQRIDYTGETGTPVVGQTLTAGDETAEITRVGTGYIVVEDVTGTLSGTITTDTFSATLSAVGDYINQSGESQWYYALAESGVPCRFYYKTRKSQGYERKSSGEIDYRELRLALKSDVGVVSTGCKIVTTTSGYSGIYLITALHPLSDCCGVGHFEANLQKEV